MGTTIRNIEEMLIVKEGQTSEDVQKSLNELFGLGEGAKTFTYGNREERWGEIVDTDGDPFPDGDQPWSVYDMVEKIVSLFASGSYITFFDEDEFMFYDYTAMDSGTKCREFSPTSREDLFGKD